MSTVILVATAKGKSWVIENADWETSWETQAIAHSSDSKNLFTFDRSQALLLAHNIQRKRPSENGVWEVRIPKGNAKGNATSNTKEGETGDETGDAKK
tara:strand:+ start:696 stop:989 length:294 start_codon:yes stop_codon:yes gene_type:complete